MSIKDIAKLGRLLGQFVILFADCFARPEGRQLLLIYVRGLLSDVPRKNVEAMALDQKVPPWTLQPFLSDIVWDHSMLRDRCQKLLGIWGQILFFVFRSSPNSSLVRPRLYGPWNKWPGRR